jgi:hypothetical protein
VAIRSLGYVTVPTPGTPVPATANLTDPTVPLSVQAIRFQVLPGNTGVVRIGLTGMDDSPTAAGENVLAHLPAPAHATTGPFAAYEARVTDAPAGLNAAQFAVDADQADDGVVVSVVIG